jgi:hypothetical protein
MDDYLQGFLRAGSCRLRPRPRRPRPRSAAAAAAAASHAGHAAAGRRRAGGGGGLGGGSGAGGGGEGAGRAGSFGVEARQHSPCSSMTSVKRAGLSPYLRWATTTRRADTG